LMIIIYFTLNCNIPLNVKWDVYSYDCIFM